MLVQNMYEYRALAFVEVLWPYNCITAPIYTVKGTISHADHHHHFQLAYMISRGRSFSTCVCIYVPTTYC